MNPRIFVGSSKEGGEVAGAIQENLEEKYKFRVTLWDQDIFKLSENTLESLINTLDRFDFGIFVFSPDDITDMRGQQTRVPRDNVVFELGLFIGRLGKERSFIVMPKNVRNLHLPTDLAGLTTAKYDSRRLDVVAALGTTCNKIKRAIDAPPVKDDVEDVTRYRKYVGPADASKYVVIAHCDDTSKFDGLGVLSPGGTILQEIRGTPTSSDQAVVQVRPESVVNWDAYNDASTMFIVDSPYYNPYTQWIMEHYGSYLAGGEVEFTKTEPTDVVRQEIHTASEVFRSDKKEGMGLFDEFEDYLLIMRLPRMLPHMFHHETHASEADENTVIWVVAGIHSKASHAGARLFKPKNLKRFISELTNEYRSELPQYFEAVYKLPRTPKIVDDFSHLKRVHFSVLRLKSEIGLEDGIPAGLARFFVNGEVAPLKSIPIHTVHLDPIAACNFQCPHCIEREERDKGLRLSMNTIVRILCDLKEIGCRNLNFYGGEPTLHPNFSTILQLACNLDFSVLVVTNGDLLSEKGISETIIRNRRNICLRISLDGNSRETHARNHGLPLEDSIDHFARIRNSIVGLINRGVLVVVSFLLLDNCIREIQEACRFWKDKGATALSLRPVTEVCGREPAIRYDFTQGHVIRKIVECYRGWVIVPDWFRKFLLTGKEPDYVRPYGRCYSAYYRFVISPYKTSIDHVQESGIEETDEAWISLCPYHRYNERYGCEYPENLEEWAQGERITKAEGICSIMDNCHDILCCRDKHNQRVAEEIRHYEQRLSTTED